MKGKKQMCSVRYERHKEEKYKMRKQGIKKGMSVLSAFIIGFTTVAGLMGSGITSKAATTNISNPRIADDGTVTWDKVTFGSYYQDMNEMVAEPIKWRILSVRTAKHMWVSSWSSSVTPSISPPTVLFTVTM